MIKRIVTTAAALVALSTTAFAGGFSVTEIAASGIKRANGVWAVTVDGDKVSGKAEMQLDNGTPVTYKIDGKVEGGVYTLNFADRTDGRKDCVWVGKPADGAKVYNGEVTCAGEKFSIRAGVQ